MNEQQLRMFTLIAILVSSVSVCMRIGLSAMRLVCPQSLTPVERRCTRDWRRYEFGLVYKAPGAR